MGAFRIVCDRVFKPAVSVNKTPSHTKVAVGARHLRHARHAHHAAAKKAIWVCTVAGGIGAAVVPPLFFAPGALPGAVEGQASGGVESGIAGSSGPAEYFPPEWGAGSEAEAPVFFTLAPGNAADFAAQQQAAVEVFLPLVLPAGPETPTHAQPPQQTPQPVPEPSTLTLLATAVVALLARARP